MPLYPDGISTQDPDGNDQQLSFSRYRLLVNPNYVDPAGLADPEYLIRDPKVPAKIAADSRYVITNPFGNGVWVECTAEVFHAGTWVTTGQCYTNTNGFSTSASCKLDEGIILQTGDNCCFIPRGGLTGGTSTGSNNGVNNIPVRIHIERIGGDEIFKDIPIATELKLGSVQLATQAEILNGKSNGQHQKVLTVEDIASLTNIGNHGSSGYKCIYSEQYSQPLAPNEIKDPNLPLNINARASYKLSNPFNKFTPVLCQVEILDIDGKWKVPGSIGVNSANYGVSCVWNSSEGILYLSTGQYFNVSMIGTNTNNYMGRGESTDHFSTNLATAPCRIHVWKIGNSDIPVISGKVPDTKIAQYIYSSEYEHIMRWDDTLGFYRSTEVIDIHATMHPTDQLQKGRYFCDGSTVALSTRPGMVLNSQSAEIKAAWKIVSDDTSISLPDLKCADGRWYHQRFGALPGQEISDAIREISGGISGRNWIGDSGHQSFGSFKTVPSGTSAGFSTGGGGAYSWYASLAFSAALTVPTAPENRILAKTFIPVITLGI